MDGLTMLLGLIAAHAVADFWMQSDALARMKNRHRSSETLPGHWPYALGSHAIHHGVAVFVVTQSIPAALAETVAHALIDFGKCENWYGIHTDQWLHFCCKSTWVAFLAWS